MNDKQFKELKNSIENSGICEDTIYDIKESIDNLGRILIELVLHLKGSPSIYDIKNLIDRD